MLKYHLVRSGKYLKLPLGPIISPSPGPTLEREVAAAEIAVVKSRLLNDSRAVRRKKIKVLSKELKLPGLEMVIT